MAMSANVAFARRLLNEALAPTDTYAAPTEAPGDAAHSPVDELADELVHDLTGDAHAVEHVVHEHSNKFYVAI
eukprot:8492824-Pyramimonas_sp.AAC.1